jgi:class 3 adenylate cyclase
MFTDIEGSCALKRMMPGQTGSERDEQFRQQIKAPHDELISGSIEKHGGTLINPTGDGFCFVFANPEEAVQCALGIQDQLGTSPIQTPAGVLKLRIGLHTEYVDPSGADVFSTTMDKAARIQSVAESGYVVLSAQTRLLVDEMKGVTFKKIPNVELKGIGFVDLFGAKRQSDLREVASALENDETQIARMHKVSPRVAIRWAYNGHIIEAMEWLCAAAHLSYSSNLVTNITTLVGADLITPAERQNIVEIYRVAALAEKQSDFNVTPKETWRLCQQGLEISNSLKKKAAELRDAFFGPG